MIGVYLAYCVNPVLAMVVLLDLLISSLWDSMIRIACGGKCSVVVARFDIGKFDCAPMDLHICEYVIVV